MKKMQAQTQTQRQSLAMLRGRPSRLGTATYPLRYMDRMMQTQMWCWLLTPPMNCLAICHLSFHSLTLAPHTNRQRVCRPDADYLNWSVLVQSLWCNRNLWPFVRCCRHFLQFIWPFSFFWMLSWRRLSTSTPRKRRRLDWGVRNWRISWRSWKITDEFSMYAPHVVTWPSHSDPLLRLQRKHSRISV